jgi:membrane protein implicated in regulation of membrane protease activity
MRKSLAFVIALTFSILFLWASFRVTPKFAFYLILPAFALAVRVFSVHGAGRELDFFTYAVTAALLTAITYAIMRIVFRSRRDRSRDW